VLMLSILFTAAFIVTVRTKRSEATLQ
jgi:hypothetical protein